jgi:hypothetical protein
MESPATSERIRMACVDEITKMARTDSVNGEMSWSIRS